MHSSKSFAPLIMALIPAVAQGHVVVLNAQGLAGSNNSVGFAVDPAIARNCTLINPCQLDTTLIREAEINANLVNLCGRTQLGGNIDIAFNTEAAIAAGTVTQVQKGSELTILMHQVNADGAGPYECDIDEGSNSSVMEKKLEMITNVPGTNGVSQAMVKQFNITAKMPEDFTCYGASTGNICTVRCRNNAIAGPFGGCFAVQQIDVEPTVNTAKNVQTFKSGSDIVKQIEGNLKDLTDGNSANALQGAADSLFNAAHSENLLLATIKSNVYPVTVQPDEASGAGVGAGKPATTTKTAADSSVTTGVAASTTSSAARSPATSAASTPVNNATATSAAVLGKRSGPNGSGLRWGKRVYFGV